MENRKGKPITVDGWGDVNPASLHDMPAEDLERLKSLLEIKLAAITSQIETAEEKKAALGENASDLEWGLRAKRARALFSSLLYQTSAALKRRERVDRITHERAAKMLWYRSFLCAAKRTLSPADFDRLAAAADEATSTGTANSRAEMTDVP